MLSPWLILSLLLALTATVLAQESEDSLTLTFSLATANTCLANGTTGGITISTNTIPYYYSCFNVHDIFTQNTSRGFQPNAADLVPGGSFTPAGINHTLYGAQTYNLPTNYSHVWYDQVNSTGKVKAGKAATRSLKVYSGVNCTEVGDPILPSYWWSCQSGPTGQCDTLPYGVASFTIDATSHEPEKQCWNFALEGKAAPVLLKASSGLWFAAAVVAVVLYV